MNPLLIVSLTFLATTGLVYALAEARTRGTRRVRDRLDRVTGRFQAAPPSSGGGTAGLSEPRPDALPTVTRWLGNTRWEARLRLAMLRADLRLRPAEWVGLCAGVSLAAWLLGLLLTRQWALGLAFGLLGLCLPLAVLGSRQESRRRRFDAQTPDALMLMTSSLRAGHSFSQALRVVADELPPPLADEFAWASGEARLGVPLDLALGRMTERVRSPDLDLIVTAILIQLPVGGNLAEVLDAIGDTIRERVRTQGEVQTLTAEGRLSAIVLIVLAPLVALALQLRDPGYFQPLIDSPAGRGMIAGAVGGQIVGGLLIRRMVRLDV